MRGWSGAVQVPPGLKPGANARPAGEDVARGALALPAGRRLRAPEIGLAAALGLPRAAGARRWFGSGCSPPATNWPRPAPPLGPAQTYDSNRFTLLALLARLPVVATDLGILPDQAAATAAALREAAAARRTCC